MDNSVDHALLLPRPPEKLTLSEKFADAVAGGMGSWTFVAGHALAMAAWIAVNKTGIAPAIPQFDPNLILLNLVLSTEAALGAAFILMSQGRKTDIARKKRAHDLEVDISSDRKISALDKQLDELLSILSPEQLKKIKENTFDNEDEGPVYGPEEAPKPSLRERFSDAVTRGMGSWKFVIGHTLFQAAWIALNCTNVIPWMPKFDPNLTLLNLFLSTEAAFAGAFILMSQNRQGEQDDKTMDHDLGVDINAGRKLQAMQQKMAAIMEILTPDQLRALAAAREAALATANANKKEEPSAATTTAAAAHATPPSNDDTKAVPKPKAAQAGGPK